MNSPPILKTDRLILRLFTLEDAPDVQGFVSNRDIASNTSAIPHPYEDGLAEEWISTHKAELIEGTAIHFAITLICQDNVHESILIGCISLDIDQTEKIGELGYWVGKPYWNKGYCTEAAKEIIKYGFDVVGLNSIHAFHFRRNPASGRVLEKIGMQFEECFPKAVEKWGVTEDLIKYNMFSKHQIHS